MISWCFWDVAICVSLVCLGICISSCNLYTLSHLWNQSACKSFSGSSTWFIWGQKHAFSSSEWDWWSWLLFFSQMVWKSLTGPENNIWLPPAAADWSQGIYVDWTAEWSLLGFTKFVLRFSTYFNIGGVCLMSIPPIKLQHPQLFVPKYVSHSLLLMSGCNINWPFKRLTK